MKFKLIMVFTDIDKTDKLLDVERALGLTEHIRKLERNIPVE